MTDKYVAALLIFVCLIGGVLIGQGILAHEDARSLLDAIRSRP